MTDQDPQVARREIRLSAEIHRLKADLEQARKDLADALSPISSRKTPVVQIDSDGKLEYMIEGKFVPYEDIRQLRERVRELEERLDIPRIRRLLEDIDALPLRPEGEDE